MSALPSAAETGRRAEIIPISFEAEKTQAALDSLPAAEGIYRHVPTRLLNRFGQQREGSNEIQGELDKSIEQLGVLEPVLVSVMTAEELSAYITFTNQTWGDAATLEACRPFTQTSGGDDLYMALIGGHSRVGSVEAVAKKQGQHIDDSVRIEARIIPVESAVDLAVKQAAENIHSRPSPYRTIRLVANAYLFRISQGENVSRRAFAKEVGVTEQTLRDSLNYAALPASVREQTDRGLIPIGVSVELARAFPALREETFLRVLKTRGIEKLDEWTSQADEEYQELLKLELFRHVTAHNGSTNRGRSTVTRQQIRLHSQGVRRKLGMVLAPVEDLEMNLFDARDYVDMEVVERRKRLRSEIEHNLKDFASERKQQARNLHNWACIEFDMTELRVDEQQEDEAMSLGGAALELISA